MTHPRRTEASLALAETFYGDYGRLTQPQRDTLIAHLLALHEAERGPTLHGTARELQHRISPATLASYARTLTASSMIDR